MIWFWKFRYEILAAALVAAIFAGVLYVKNLQADNARKTAALVVASAALRTASIAIGERDTAITKNADHEAADASQTASFWKGQARAAFDAGYASRRCDGSQPVGVQHDLRTLWQAGAFTAAGPAAAGVPGKP